MYSFPNLLPLPAAEVSRIAGAVQRLGRFDRLYGAFPHAVVRQGAKQAVARSCERYRAALEGRLARRYF